MQTLIVEVHHPLFCCPGPCDFHTQLFTELLETGKEEFLTYTRLLLSSKPCINVYAGWFHSYLTERKMKLYTAKRPGLFQLGLVNSAVIGKQLKVSM